MAGISGSAAADEHAMNISDIRVSDNARVHVGTLATAALYSDVGSVIGGLGALFPLTLVQVYRLETLKGKVQDVEQSLRVIGDLVSMTKDISETDLDLAMPAIISATVQITLLKQDLVSFGLLMALRPSGLERRSAKALINIDAVALDVDNLRKILTIAYWNGVEPTPVAEHSTLDRELMSTRAYKMRVYQEHLSLEEQFDLLQIVEDEKEVSSDNPAAGSTLYEARSTSHNLDMTNNPLPNSQYSGRSAVDEASAPVQLRKEYESSLNTEDYKSTSASYASGSNILTGPGKAPYMYTKIYMRDASGTGQELNCLLDTGASVNCISKRQAQSLDSHSRGLIRRTKSPPVLQAANGDLIESELLFKGAWNFVNRDTGYTHLFHLIDGLPTDVLISRETIFQYGFLVQNPDLLPLGFPDVASTVPGLNVLGMAKISKVLTEQQTRQDQHKMEKALGNKEERKRQKEQLKERLNQLMSSNQGPSFNQQRSASQGPHQGP